MILRDEVAHAQLSRDLDAWLRARLSPRACRQLDALRSAALDELRSRVSGRHFVPTLGLPQAAERMHLIDAVADLAA